MRRGCRLGAVGLWLSGCGVAPGNDDPSADAESSTGGGTTDAEHGTTDALLPDACAEACVDVASDDGTARCHSCRCKVAFDDWMPAPDEVQCANAVPIITYDAEVSGSEVILEPAPINAAACANPSLLTGSCRPGSRLGRLEHDDVMLQWICRDPYLDLDGTVIFHDVAVIGHNLRSGATCFWDDVDDITHEDDLPVLDLEAATEEQRARHLDVFDLVDPGVCTNCHDHDPFLYTPYLESTGWVSVAIDKGPYSIVSLDPETSAVDAMHLVSDAAAPCLACHRLGSNNTCGRFAGDAMGMNKDDHYQGEVRDAAVPGSPTWELAYWMPSASLPITDYETWLATFGEARDHILACCESPGEDVGDCRWESVPAE